MAIATGTTDPAPIYRALIVDRYTDATWSEYLQARSRADDGRDPAGTHDTFEEAGTDDDRPEPTRSEPADFGGGDSTGVQDL